MNNTQDNSEPLRSSGWLGIKSAPKDETRVLLSLEDEVVAIGWWSKHSHCWLGDELEPLPFILKPTRWMPLPDLPNNQVTHGRAQP